jgi:hypothetical protein
MRALVLILALGLAGCGGAVVPASHSQPAMPESGLRMPDATSRASVHGGLWISGRSAVLVYDVNNVLTTTGSVAPSNELDGICDYGSGDTHRAIVDAAVAPDGTYYALVTTWTYPPQANGVANHWKLKIYAPGARGRDAPQQVITGTGSGVAVALDTNVIDVLVSDGTRSAPHGYVASYEYGHVAGNRFHPAADASPIRTLTFPYAPGYLALDRNAQMYVNDSAGHVLVYPKHRSGPAPSPVRTITLPTDSGPFFALGPAGDIWTAKPLSSNIDPEKADVYGLRAGNNGPAADVTWRYPYDRISGLAVDDNDTVFVGRNGVITINANGGAGPFAALEIPYSPAIALGGFTQSVLAVGPAPVPASR